MPSIGPFPFLASTKTAKSFWNFRLYYCTIDRFHLTDTRSESCGTKQGIEVSACTSAEHSSLCTEPPFPSVKSEKLWAFVHREQRNSRSSFDFRRQCKQTMISQKLMSKIWQKSCSYRTSANEILKMNIEQRSLFLMKAISLKISKTVC